MPETMRGTVESIVYQTDEFTVATFKPDDRPLPVRIVGPMPGINPHMELLVSGSWTKHTRFGEQFRVETFAQEMPRTPQGLVSYLGSGLIAGIGPGLSQRIVNRFGMDSLTVMDTDIDRLREVPGIGPKKMQKVKSAWEVQRKVARLMSALMEFGISAALAARLYKQYGDEAAQVVRLTPYRATEVPGIGFFTADRIARGVGISRAAPARIEAGVVHVLTDMAGQGHVCAPRQALVETTLELLTRPDTSSPEEPSEDALDTEMVSSAIDRLLAAGKLRAEAEIIVEPEGEPVEALYLPWLHRAETGVAARLWALADAIPTIIPDSSRLRVDPEGIVLSERQQIAVQMALSRKVMVVTGGPGTGKTTVLRSILYCLEDHARPPRTPGGQQALFASPQRGEIIALAAPTGRAAKRLAEVTGHQASTVHRLLGASGPGHFEHDERNTLRVDTLILDETSMVDIVLFYALLQALPPHAHLVFVGDADQLPSVGPGDVMRDLVESGAVPTVRLDTIFRQAADSNIVSNAHRINRGEMPLFPQDNQDDTHPDFFFFSADEQEAAADLMVELVARRIPARFGCDPSDVQVLSPLRKRGEAAADAVNRRLQAALNPPRRGVAECRVGERIFRVGDRVIQTRNDYQRQVFNGEVGTVVSIEAEERKLVAQFDAPVAYAFDDLGDLDLAYALSVHKSQGSEYPVVIVPVLSAHYMMLRRNLLYTAVTRAKKMVVIVGQRKAIRTAVSEGRREKRYSGLRWRLAGGSQCSA